MHHHSYTYIGFPIMMYKGNSTEPFYYGEDWSREIPIMLFNTLPDGKPEPVVPKMFDPETLQKVRLSLIKNEK